MKPLTAFIALNLATCGTAVPAAAMACDHLPAPAGAIALLFLTTAAGGVLVVSFLWLLIRSTEP